MATRIITNEHGDKIYIDTKDTDTSKTIVNDTKKDDSVTFIDRGITNNKIHNVSKQDKNNCNILEDNKSISVDKLYSEKVKDINKIYNEKIKLINDLYSEKILTCTQNYNICIGKKQKEINLKNDRINEIQKFIREQQLDGVLRDSLDDNINDLKEEIDDLKDEISELQDELNDEVSDLKDELNDEVSDLKDEFKDQINKDKQKKKIINAKYEKVTTYKKHKFDISGFINLLLYTGLIYFIIIPILNTLPDNDIIITIKYGLTLSSRVLILVAGLKFLRSLATIT